MPADEFRAYLAKHAKPREEPPVNDVSLLRVTVYILGGALLLCLAGIIWLASANPAREIPDILVATTTGILGLIGGILVPSKSAS